MPSITVEALRRRLFLLVALVLPTAASLAQTSIASSAYPTRPRPLPELEEIELAMSAAPAEISAAADIYVLRADGPAKARSGTNGCSCMVARDLHAGSLYPICFDAEGTRTVLHRELMELDLRARGRSEKEVQEAVAEAYATGRLKTPDRPAMSYMMSSKQVLFASAFEEGRRVGAWSPHVMLYLPNATPEQFGLASPSRVTQFFVVAPATRGAHLVIKVPLWADSGATMPRSP
jgi:hypothetical protein